MPNLIQEKSGNLVKSATLIALRINLKFFKQVYLQWKLSPSIAANFFPSAFFDRNTVQTMSQKQKETYFNLRTISPCEEQNSAFKQSTELDIKISGFHIHLVFCSNSLYNFFIKRIKRKHYGTKPFVMHGSMDGVKCYSCSSCTASF